MDRPLSDRVIALAEGRQIEELATLLEADGAACLRCPMLSIQDSPDEAKVQAWLSELIADRFDWVVLMTGEGLRRLLTFADRSGRRGEAIAALARTRTLTRGPKPVRALKEVGLAPTKVAAAPTTDGVITSLRDELRPGQVVGVQHYGPENPALEAFLLGAGVLVSAVCPYVYAPGTDADRVADLIDQMRRGQVDVVVFTSSPQVDRLYEVAAERGLLPALAAAWQRVRVAAVGPVVADNLRRRGAPVHISPAQGFVMKNLVRLIREELAMPAGNPACRPQE